MKLIMERVICWRIPRLWLIERGAASWQAWRQVVALAMTEEDNEALTALSSSRTKPEAKCRGSDDTRPADEDAIVLCRGTKT